MSAVALPAEYARDRTMQLTALVLLAGLLAFAYRDTLYTIGAKWFSDMTYSHGGLVVPIGLWLAWRNRRAVESVNWTPSGWGVLVLALASLAWLVAGAAGILVAQQLALVVMVSALVLAVLGWQAYRPLAFALAFLVFAVPFGRGLVPGLMQVTADITVTALQWTGVPVFRNGMLLSIPGGDFEVARACSGLNYLMTGIVLGTLYGYLTYSDWRKRIAFVAACVAVLILANGVRAYLTIAIAHWSDMRYGTGYDHIVFGRILFLAVIVAMFWIGQRWRDPAAEQVSSTVAPAPPAAHRGLAGLVVAACALLILLTPWYLVSATRRAGVNPSAAGARITFPAAEGAWQGPHDTSGSWRPLFNGAAAERAGRYVNEAGDTVDLYVAVYALGAPGDGEMISYRNRLYPQEHRSLIAERPFDADAGGGVALPARELLVPDRDGDRLVWYWFMIGDQVTASRSVAKALEALALIVGRADYGRVVTLAAPARDEHAARRSLAAFVHDHGACVQSGFESPDCPG
jgi:exosortase A